MATVYKPVTGQDVADFLGRGSDANTVALAGVHVGIVTDLAMAYTRGKGFLLNSSEPNPEVSSVIVMATARVTVNPEQNKREAFGEYQVTPGTLYGWTLTELAVLNRYRKRSTSGRENNMDALPNIIDGGLI